MTHQQQATPITLLTVHQQFPTLTRAIIQRADAALLAQEQHL